MNLQLCKFISIRLILLELKREGQIDAPEKDFLVKPSLIRVKPYSLKFYKNTEFDLVRFSRMDWIWAYNLEVQIEFH